MCPDNYQSINVVGITETSLLPDFVINNRDTLNLRSITDVFEENFGAKFWCNSPKIKQNLVYSSSSFPIFL